MITSIHFQNFKALRDTTLPLGRFTIIVGPNGSGKSTAMDAIRFAANPKSAEFELERILSVGVTKAQAQTAEVNVSIKWSIDGVETTTQAGRRQGGEPFKSIGPLFSRGSHDNAFENRVWRSLKTFRIFSFDAKVIAAPVATVPDPQLGEDGANLAAVLDALRDSHPERFESLNEEFQRWLPEFDRILFATPDQGKKRFLVRTTNGHHRLAASDLSQGILFALAFLTIAYLPEPPSIVCFEEPDRGIHPRLLVDIRDAMYRLAFPEKYGERRDPVQVIATTHSPYLLDLYKEQPEQIVIAHKDEQGAHFERLSEKPHLNEILEGAPLGEIWYSGILGGVPRTP